MVRAPSGCFGELVLRNCARTVWGIARNVAAQSTHCLGLIRDNHDEAAVFRDPARQIAFVLSVRPAQVDRQLVVTDLKISEAQEHLFLYRPGSRSIGEAQVQDRITRHIRAALHGLQVKLAGNLDVCVVLHGLAPCV